MNNSKVWIVTGASRGIGMAVARRALEAGDRVAILARGAAAAASTLDAGQRCLACPADVTDRGEVDRAVQQVMDAWGRIDVLVNNAGLHRGGKIHRLADDAWSDVLQTNLSGAMHAIRAASNHLAAGSAIVNVGAVVGFRGFPGDVAYASSKAGLAGLTRALAVEMAPQGVRVNLVIPGLVLTEMTGELSEKSLESMRRMIPMGRYGEAAEIADVIFWVANATYMTGAFIPTDGGLMSTFGMPT